MLDEKITFDKFIRWVLIAALVFSILYIVNYLSHVLLPFFIAWLLAYLLNPVVNFVQHKMKVKVRALAVIRCGTEPEAAHLRVPRAYAPDRPDRSPRRPRKLLPGNFAGWKGGSARRPTGSRPVRGEPRQAAEDRQSHSDLC